MLALLKNAPENVPLAVGGGLSFAGACLASVNPSLIQAQEFSGQNFVSVYFPHLVLRCLFRIPHPPIPMVTFKALARTFAA